MNEQNSEQRRLQRLYEQEIIANGSLNVAFPKKTAVLLMIPVVLLSAWVLFCVGLLLSFIIVDIGAVAKLIILGMPHILGFLILPLALDILLFRLIVGGYSCTYKADNIEFTVTRKNLNLLNILYKNAVSVEYKPMKFLWINQGFHVIITMKTYTLSLDYVVPSKKMLFHPEDFPFEIIRKKIGEQNVD